MASSKPPAFKGIATVCVRVCESVKERWTVIEFTWERNKWEPVEDPEAQMIGHMDDC